MSGKSEEAIFIKGKNAFAEICNSCGCEHLHIRQEKEDPPNGMKEKDRKRPDFLVNIPDLTSLFIDVKVRQQVETGSSHELSGVKAFEVDCHDYWKMKKLESRMRISSWYAFVEMKGATGIYESSAFLVPIPGGKEHSGKDHQQTGKGRGGFLEGPDTGPLHERMGHQNRHQ